MKVSKFVIFGPNTTEHHNTIEQKLRNGSFTRIYGSNYSTLSPSAIRKDVWFIDVNTKTYMYETLREDEDSNQLLSWGPVYNFIPQQWNLGGFREFESRMVTVKNIGSLSIESFLTRRNFKSVMSTGAVEAQYLNIDLESKTFTITDDLLHGVARVSFAKLIDEVLKEEEKVMGINLDDYGHGTLISKNRTQTDIASAYRTNTTITAKPVDHTIVVYTNNAQTLVFHNIENFTVTSTGFSFDYKGKLTNIKRHAVFNNTSTAGYALADE